MNRRDSIAATWARPGTIWTSVAGLALAAAIGWLSLPREPDGDADGSAPVPSSFAGDADRIVRSPVHEDVDPTSSSLRPSGSELVEVCGLGWVEPDASGGWDTSAAGAVPDVAASERALLASMRRDGGDFGSATATVLELAGGPDRELAAALRDRLAKQAAATLDARVYALALKECEATAVQGSCALLNLEQWARLDDGNAVPWLHILQRAEQRNDIAQVQEALHRIGAASRADERLFAAAGQVADHSGASDPDVMAAQLLAVEAYLRTSTRATPFGPLPRVCSAAAIADANRRQTCDSAAATLAERSDSLMAVLVGTTLGQRLGWSDERVAALRGLQVARTAMARQGMPTVETASSVEVASTCGGARRLLAMFSGLGRAGEMQPIRDWLATNGASIAPYARQAHEMLRSREAQEAAAAAADDAASAAAAAAMPASAAVAIAPAGGASPYSEGPPPAR